MINLEYKDLVLIKPWSVPLPHAPRSTASWVFDQMAYLTEGKIYEVRDVLDENWVQVYAWHSDHHFGCWPIKYIELVSKRP